MQLINAEQPLRLNVNRGSLPCSSRHSRHGASQGWGNTEKRSQGVKKRQKQHVLPAMPCPCVTPGHTGIFLAGSCYTRCRARRLPREKDVTGVCACEKRSPDGVSDKNRHMVGALGRRCFLPSSYRNTPLWGECGAEHPESSPSVGGWVVDGWVVDGWWVVDGRVVDGRVGECWVGVGWVVDGWVGGGRVGGGWVGGWMDGRGMDGCWMGGWVGVGWVGGCSLQESQEHRGLQV